MRSFLGVRSAVRILGFKNGTLNRIGSTAFSASTFGSKLDGLHVSQGLYCRHLSSDQIVNDAPSAKVICQSISDLQYSGGMEEAVQAALPLLAEKIDRSADNFSVDDIANAFFGMQSISSEQDGGLLICQSLCCKLYAQNDELTMQHIAQIMFGLQGMSSDHKSIKELILYLTNKLSSLPTEIVSREVLADLMCGLHSMDPTHHEVLELMTAIANRADATGGPCNDEAILEAMLHGLNLADSDYEPARRLTAVVTGLMKGSRAILSDDGVLAGLTALRLMDSNSVECLEFVGSLSDCIQRRISSGEINMQTSDVVDVFSCLYGFSSDAIEVRRLLHPIRGLFVDKLKMDEITEDDVYTMLELFGSFTDKPEEVRLLLGSFKEKMESLPFMLDSEAIGDLLQDCFRNYNFQDCSEVRELVSMLHYKSEVKV